MNHLNEPESIVADFEVLDDRFASVGGDSRIQRLYDDCRWAEGRCTSQPALADLERHPEQPDVALG